MVRKRERKTVIEADKTRDKGLAIRVAEVAPRANPPQHLSVIDLRKVFLYYFRTKAYTLEAIFF